MCTKHVVLVPMKHTVVDSAMQKSCKPAMLGRMWHASRQALRLNHSPVHQFACSQWQVGNRPSTLYILYRWLVFITISSIGIASFACQQLPKWYEGPIKQINYYKWFIYFTNWGYLMIILQSALALAVVHKFRNQRTYSLPCEEDEDSTRTPLLCRAYWLAYNIATDLALVITLMYWTAVYNPKKNEIDALNLLVHGGNSLVMLSEIAVTAHPIRAAHALYGAGTGLAYGVFSAFYFAVGGTDRTGQQDIYSMLDWNKPGSALGFVTLCAFVMVLAHMFATALANARARLDRRLKTARPQSDCVTLPTH